MTATAPRELAMQQARELVSTAALACRSARERVPDTVRDPESRYFLEAWFGYTDATRTKFQLAQRRMHLRALVKALRKMRAQRRAQRCAPVTVEIGRLAA
jgi:hypothetical protein